MKKKQALKTILALVFGTAMASASAAATDPALLDAARTQQASLLSTLKDLVLIESGSADGPGLLRVADYAERRLKELGAAVERRQATKGPGSIVIGSLKGKGSKRFMLMAHMDTVYQSGILATQPHRVDGNRVYGPGIADDKSGVALILHTIEMLKKTGWSDYAQITVVFNPDEEVGSPGSGELIAALAAEHDFVFSCEPNGDGYEGLLMATSGVATATMTVKGRASHAGFEPKAGRNALIELSHQLVQTQDIKVPGAQLNWTHAEAGLARNQIPASATATGDVRLASADGGPRLQEALREKVRTALVPDTETTVEVSVGTPPFIATDAARAWAVRAQAIYGELDRKLNLYPASGGASDAAWAGRSGKAVVLECFALSSGGTHGKNEYIAIDSIVPRLYLLGRMMKEAGAAK
jgi:glutamate carboxypeptidase